MDAHKKYAEQAMDALYGEARAGVSDTLYSLIRTLIEDAHRAGYELALSPEHRRARLQAALGSVRVRGGTQAEVD